MVVVEVTFKIEEEKVPMAGVVVVDEDAVGSVAPVSSSESMFM